jgi:hypothetical protein
VIFDIIGALFIALKYILWLSNDSMLFLAYPVWFVVAVFNGFFYADYGFNKIKNSENLQTKTWVITLIAVILSIALLMIFECFDQLKTNGIDEYWVPGNLGLTLNYFITLCSTTLLFKK